MTKLWAALLAALFASSTAAAGSFGAAVDALRRAAADPSGSVFDGTAARPMSAMDVQAEPAAASSVPAPVQDYINGVEISDAYAQQTFKQCLPNTLETTVRRQGDGSTFVITGDIPAMWTRDSCAQLNPYVYMAKGNPDLQGIIRGTILTSAKHFNSPDPDAPFINSWKDDGTLWERKLEPDGVAYVIRLTYLYWKVTGDESWAHQTGDFDMRHAFDKAVDLLKSSTGPTGMVKCPNRPSDDWTKYPYLVPTNMFLAATLPKLEEMYSTIWKDQARAAECAAMSRTIRDGIQKYATVQHPTYGTIFAFETDGAGNNLLMDDANVPSLLSAPYIEYCSNTDPIYQNTRRFVLSHDNPNFAEGANGSGIGSPHTPGNKLWPMAVAMQAMTSTDPGEIQGVIKELDNLDAGTHYMHEGVNPDNPGDYSRPWFAWANSMYAELIMKKGLGLNYYPGDGTYVKPNLGGDVTGPVDFGSASGIKLRVEGSGSTIVSATVNGRPVRVDPEKGIKLTGNSSDVVIYTR